MARASYDARAIDVRTIVRNEFATVVLEQRSGEPLVRIEDVRTGRSVELDPLELEALTRLSRDDLSVLVDPSFRGLAYPDRPLESFELVPGEGEE